MIIDSAATAMPLEAVALTRTDIKAISLVCISDNHRLSKPILLIRIFLCLTCYICIHIHKGLLIWLVLKHVVLLQYLLLLIFKFLLTVRFLDRR